MLRLPSAFSARANSLRADRGMESSRTETLRPGGALLRESSSVRSGDALANAQLGMCYLEVGNYADARTFLLRARTIDPGHFTLPQLSLADIYLRQGATEAARRELEDFLARHPDSPLAPNVRRQLQRLGTK